MLNGKKVVALIQARCTSARLPMKHFRCIGGKRVIDWVIDRLKDIKEIDEIIISTTNDISDTPLKDYAAKKGIGFYGYDGNIDDVVGRHYNAVKNSNADYIICVSGDCCLSDSDYLKSALYKLEEGYDVLRVKNWIEYQVEGMEVFNMSALEEVNKKSITGYERENFFYVVERKELDVKTGYIELEEVFKGRKYRISVDNLADLRFMNEIHSNLQEKNQEFNIKNSLELLREKPELANLNSHIEQKKLGEKNYKILIKTEAAKSKGLGHLRRTITLGNFLNENKNNGVLYAINNDNIAIDILNEKGYIYDYQLAETEEEIINLINSYNADILIIDIQKLEGNTKYDFSKIKKLTEVKKIILIDKVVDNEHVDLIVVQGIQSDEFEKNSKCNEKVINGLDCVFINNEFKLAKVNRLKYKEKKNEKEVVILFGASDPKDFTIKVIKELNNINIDFINKFKIILGPYYKNKRQLIEEIRTFKYDYEIIENPKNLAEEIMYSDFGIIAYGVSFYEFLYMGIPTINFPLHEYDVPIVNKIENLQLGYSGENLCRQLEKIKNNENVKIEIGDLNRLYDIIINDI